MNKIRHQHLWQYVDYWAEKNPEGTALRSDGQCLTWKEFAGKTDVMAQTMIEQGLGRADVIATMLPASIAYIATLIAADKIGAIVCAMDIKYKQADLAMTLSHVAPKLIIALARENTGSGDLNRVIDRLGMAGRVDVETVSPDSIPLVHRFDPKHCPSDTLFDLKAAQCPEDGMLIVFTGGTTGVPKAALLSKLNVAGMAGAEARFLDTLLAGTRTPGRTKTLAALPPSHVGGTVELFGSGMAGGKEIIIHEAWSPLKVLQTIEKEGLPWIGGVPTMYALMLMTPELESIDLSSLKFVVMSGEKVEKDLLEMIRARICPHVIVGYGSTEGGAEVTFTALEDDPEALCAGYVGTPLDGMEIIIADENGHALPPLEMGEVLTRGDFSINQYYKMPGEDRAGFTPDGFCKSGDLGLLDGRGGLHIRGRKKHIIRVGSYTVMPSEIENLVMTIPGVAMAAAIGVPDKVFGEKIWLAVSLLPGQTLDESDVISFCRDHLAKFKVPEKVVFMEELPTTRIGKVHRVEIQNRILKRFTP